MIKKVRNTLALLALAAVPIITQSQPIEAMAVPDCSDGYAKPTCPIWNVRIQAGISSYVSCETGGEWKCSHPLIEKLF
jgi:hypothetical protein